MYMYVYTCTYTYILDLYLNHFILLLAHMWFDGSIHGANTDEDPCDPMKTKRVCNNIIIIIKLSLFNTRILVQHGIS